MYDELLLSDIFLAGIPAIVQLPSSNELLTTELAPIAVSFPITIGPNNFAPGPI